MGQMMQESQGGLLQAGVLQGACCKAGCCKGACSKGVLPGGLPGGMPRGTLGGLLHPIEGQAELLHGSLLPLIVSQPAHKLPAFPMSHTCTMLWSTI